MAKNRKGEQHEGQATGESSSPESYRPLQGSSAPEIDALAAQVPPAPVAAVPMVEAVGMAQVPGGGWVTYRIKVPIDSPGITLLTAVDGAGMPRNETKAMAANRLKLAVLEFLAPRGGRRG